MPRGHFVMSEHLVAELLLVSRQREKRRGIPGTGFESLHTEVTGVTFAYISLAKASHTVSL